VKQKQKQQQQEQQQQYQQRVAGAQYKIKRGPEPCLHLPRNTEGRCIQSRPSLPRPDKHPSSKTKRYTQNSRLNN
jgi:hypothetical protein